MRGEAKVPGVLGKFVSFDPHRPRERRRIPFECRAEWHCQVEDLSLTHVHAMDAVTPTACAPVISRHHAVLDGGKALDGSLARRAAVLIVFGIHAAIASATAQVHNTHMPNDHAVPDSCSLTCIKAAILH